MERPTAHLRRPNAAQLEQLPASMRSLPQWLLWRFDLPAGATHPRKVPYYVSGHRRSGPQGDVRDRARLTSFEQAVGRLAQASRFDGIGFAFLPGDGLIGIDIDHAIDATTGEIDEHWSCVIEACHSYTERSVSGSGVHIIVSGSTTSTKDDTLGLELYSGAQYFCCTGARWAGTPDDVQPIDSEVLARLRTMIGEAKAQARSIRAAVLDPKQVSAAPAARAPAAVSAGAGSDDFKRVNAAALQALDAWVPALLPAAVKQAGTGGYRVSSRALGRDLQEDLSVHPEGIVDWGTRETMTAIDLVVAVRGNSPPQAMHWLAERCGVPLQRLQLVGARRLPGQAVNGASREAVAADNPPPRRSSRHDMLDDTIEMLRNNFALIYGTESVWDGEQRMMMTLAALAHAYGSDAVKIWKASKSSFRRSDGGRWTVLPDRVVFDPACDLDADTHINLFNGFAMAPKAGNVAPMLDLVTYLCSQVSENDDECEEIRHYLLQWLAYPLQHPGAKLRTAIVMHGDEGAGKNFLTDTMIAIYGRYGATVGQDELEDRFNQWRSAKLFICGDEVCTKLDLVQNKNRLKSLVTSDKVLINAKNQPRREEANHINLMFLGNEILVLALDNSDRRYLVIATPSAKDFDYYKQLIAWREDGGVEAWYDYLLKYPLDGFEPGAPAPRTKAKDELIDLNRKTAESFWLDWSSGGIELPYRTCSIDQAYSAYLIYARANGERYPARKTMFSAQVQRIAQTMRKPCSVVPMKVDQGERVHTRKSMRIFCVLPPPADRRGVFATEAVRQFDEQLRRYRALYQRDEGGARGSD